MAIDTAGGAIWGHHTPPVPSPSNQGCSHHLVSVPMTKDKESSDTNTGDVQLQLVVAVGKVICLSATVLQTTETHTAQAHTRNGPLVYIFKMFSAEVFLYLHVTATPLSGGTGKQRWGGAVSQINDSH